MQIGLVAGLLAIQSLVLVRTDPALMLPISGGRRVADDQRALIDELDRRSMTSVYTDYWIAYRLAFETDERIRTSPFGHVVLERYPPYTRAVDDDPKAVFVLIGDVAGQFRERLEREGMRFAVQPIGVYRIFYRMRPSDIARARTWTYPFRNP